MSRIKVSRVMVMAIAAGLCGSVQAQVVVSGNYAAGIGTGTVFGTSSSTIFKAVGWTMGGEDYSLVEAELSLNYTNGGTGIFSIWSGAAAPTQRLVELEGPPQTGLGSFVFTPVTPLVMEAGGTYWLYVESIPSPTGQFGWDGTSPSMIPTGIATHVAYNFNGNPSSFRNRFEVRGTVAVSGCYANCDNSTVEPVLNVDDFTCFINEYASAQGLPHEQQVVAYANCDGSTVAPALNVDDFTCFINQYAQGCP